MPALEQTSESEEFLRHGKPISETHRATLVVWISVRGGARHDVRVKVAPGPKAILAEMISVGLQPTVHLIEGTIGTHNPDLLTQWIEQNREVILQYWNEEIDTVDAIQSLKRLS